MKYTSMKMLLGPATIIVAGFVAASPVSAAVDGASMQLAANSGNGSNLFALYQKVQRLEAQVRDLNGEVETLQHRIQQNRKSQQQLYQDLDKRLKNLEGGGSGQGNGNSGGDETSAKGNNGSTAQKAYKDSFGKLKQGKYNEAITAFKNFIAKYPDSQYTDNAWYWLGETYYVQNKLQDSEKAFQKVVNHFKSSEKVPGSLYKIGLIEAAEHHTDNAKATLQRVVDQYPKSGAAEQASKKLKAMGGS